MGMLLRVFAAVMEMVLHEIESWGSGTASCELILIELRGTAGIVHCRKMLIQALSSIRGRGRVLRRGLLSKVPLSLQVNLLGTLEAEEASELGEGDA